MTDDQEGVIKYELKFIAQKIKIFQQFQKLTYWRSNCFKEGIIGQNSEKYDAYAYGNLSCRVLEGSTEFYITGTQTSAKEIIDIADYSLVTRYDIKQNLLVATGLVAPSSEALTHAAVYQLNNRIQYVIHVHSEKIWLARQTLKLLTTAENVAYGTPEMAAEVKRLFKNCNAEKAQIFAMAGHEDGIICFASDIDDAGNLLMATLRKVEE